MLTKELLSAVLQQHIELFAVNGNEVVYTSHHCPNPVYDKSINIYELMHLCKEWAYNECQYNVSSVTCPKTEEWKSPYEWEATVYGNLGPYTSAHYADTEPEAVFKATQRVLDNKPN